MTHTNSHTEPPAYQAPNNAPQWFCDNIREAGTSHFVAMEGAEEGAGESATRVHLRCWNWEQQALPTLLFVHGFSGHTHWWSFLIPFFTDRYRVIAIDLPGMGDSEPPREYNDECFARAILAVIDQLNVSQVTAIGHSFGGVQIAIAMAMQPDRFNHGIIIDSNIKLPEEEPPRLLEPRSAHRQHATQAECAARLRLMPPQPIVNEVLANFIAHHSCTSDSEGWHWKFDPGIQNYGEIRDAEIFSTITAKVDCIYGELSWFNTDNRPQRILDYFPNPGKAVIIAGAYHHIMIDHPLELVDQINALLADNQ